MSGSIKVTRDYTRYAIRFTPDEWRALSATSRVLDVPAHVFVRAAVVAAAEAVKERD